MRKRTRGISGRRPSVLNWLRDQAYDFVYYDIGTGLDFIGDMFRGPSGYSKSLHRQTAKAEEKQKPEVPLTKSEQKIFVELVKRKKGEPQIAYWKRKKALLNTPDKRGLVKQQIALNKAMEKRKAGLIMIDASATTQGFDRGRNRAHSKFARQKR